MRVNCRLYIASIWRWTTGSYHAWSIWYFSCSSICFLLLYDWTSKDLMSPKESQSCADLFLDYFLHALCEAFCPPLASSCIIMSFLIPFVCLHFFWEEMSIVFDFVVGLEWMNSAEWIRFGVELEFMNRIWYNIDVDVCQDLLSLSTAVAGVGLVLGFNFMKLPPERDVIGTNNILLSYLWVNLHLVMDLLTSFVVLKDYSYGFQLCKLRTTTLLGG